MHGTRVWTDRRGVSKLLESFFKNSSHNSDSSLSDPSGTRVLFEKISSTFSDA